MLRDEFVEEHPLKYFKAICGNADKQSGGD